MRKRIKNPPIKKGKIAGVSISASCSDNGSINNQHPTFCLRYLSNFNEVALINNKEEKCALINKMHLLSKLSWKQVKTCGRHSNGYEKIPRKSIRVQLDKDAITDDVQSLDVFRYNGKKAMIGIIVKGLYRVLYIDFNFKGVK